jgi:hypothetical protein
VVEAAGAEVGIAGHVAKAAVDAAVIAGHVAKAAATAGKPLAALPDKTKRKRAL